MSVTRVYVRTNEERLERRTSTVRRMVSVFSFPASAWKFKKHRGGLAKPPSIEIPSGAVSDERHNMDGQSILRKIENERARSWLVGLEDWDVGLGPSPITFNIFNEQGTILEERGLIEVLVCAEYTLGMVRMHATRENRCFHV